MAFSFSRSLRSYDYRSIAKNALNRVKHALIGVRLVVFYAIYLLTGACLLACAAMGALALWVLPEEYSHLVEGLDDDP